MQFGEHTDAPIIDVISPNRGVSYEAEDEFAVELRTAPGSPSSVGIGEIDFQIYPLLDPCLNSATGCPPVMMSDPALDPCGGILGIASSSTTGLPDPIRTEKASAATRGRSTRSRSFGWPRLR